MYPVLITLILKCFVLFFCFACSELCDEFIGSVIQMQQHSSPNTTLDTESTFNNPLPNTSLWVTFAHTFHASRSQLFLVLDVQEVYDYRSLLVYFVPTESHVNQHSLHATHDCVNTHAIGVLSCKQIHGAIIRRARRCCAKRHQLGEGTSAAIEWWTVCPFFLVVCVGLDYVPVQVSFIFHILPFRIHMRTKKQQKRKNIIYF